ncbi:hypothetical protein BH09BAC5_BH09BAC5_05220 [soil metagenome]
MTEKELLKNISIVILSFSTSKRIIGFESFVLQNLNDSREISMFKEIWSTTINFENWNYPSLLIGFDKTMEALKNKYNLDENICKILVNQAACEWK